ncbi:MAG: alpha-galactosidase, partial [Lachnospiraceae bacterium]|nr:alpha-galactosidase [Lachnospiraceae bacterium]
MDEYSRFQPDPNRFPSSIGGKGFGPLAEKIHDMGLKFGIHVMRGIPRICAHSHSKVIANALSNNQESSFYDAAEIADPSSICNWNPDMYGVKNTKEGQAY